MPDGTFSIEGRQRRPDESRVGRLDRDAEPEHAEDGADDEPSLGSHELRPAGAVSYLQSASFGEIDVEADPAESGIADLDGLLEQVGTQDWQQGAMA
ncbi:hypothetical protein [Bradyrhizobium sp. AZCC 2289]|uniref:hypothetical protein n=1 Tax=Bradyrhizobium sp. AZCC 2289 TaxID=3117026 RepID=UPI002FF0CA75